MNKDKTYIENILDSVRKIEEFTKEVDEVSFLANQMMQSATILHLALIGEESNKISDETKYKINLEWREIVGFRNMAFHDYMNLSLEIVWKTIQNRIPELKEKLLEYKN